MANDDGLSVDYLQELSRYELATEWARVYRTPAPCLSPDLLRLGIAYRLQCKKDEGLKLETTHLLTECSKAAQQSPYAPAQLLARKLTPGTKLVRDWHGVGHVVTVLDEGFEYDGQTWRSLTAIAKAITGTHRNGPRFFGLSR